MDNPQTMVLFGEAEKGEYSTAYFCESLPQLVDYLGNPPPESRGLYFAIQALLFHRQLVFFRVREEGFSLPDYLYGLDLLTHQQLVPHIAALCIPGVGDVEILNAATPLCEAHHSILITTEADFYDYLSQHKREP
jgi:hypothetical protein